MEDKRNDKPVLNIMVDLETVSKEPNAGLLSIALLPFSEEEKGEEDNIESYYAVIDLASCYMAGMDMNGCQEWWMQQDPKAKAVILKATNKKSIQDAIHDAYGYLSALAEKYNLMMWCRGLDFDMPKLEYCFRRFVDKPYPYIYYNKSDVRTCLRDARIDESQYEFIGTKHHSLDDCRNDVIKVKDAMKRLRGLFK